MNHTRHVVCHSNFKILKLKNTCYNHKIFTYSNCLHKNFFIKSNVSYKYCKNAGLSKNIEKRTIIQLRHQNFSYKSSAFKDVADDEEVKRNEFVENVLANLKTTWIEQQNDKLNKRDNRRKQFLNEGPGLGDFISKQNNTDVHSENIPYLQYLDGQKQKVYLEIYGCQMNVNDAELVSAILKKNNYEITMNMTDANIILLITCAVRDSAEQKIWNKLKNLRQLKEKKIVQKIGLLGCMAERLKHKIIEEEKIVDIVAGPDSYKDLPRLLAVSNEHETAINVALSIDETYADVTPVRLNPDSKTANVSIMRGCDNMCTYCIVPFTRGRERSRPVASILDEVQQLSDQGFKEVTLLGQNVNSYRDLSQTNFYNNSNTKTKLAKGFTTVYKNKQGGLRFSDLLDKVALINPEMRIRFTSPHPKDFPDQVLHLISERPNICKQLHLPAQSGSTNVLARMRRGYTREAYLDLVYHIRSIIPKVAFSSDFIAGFCNETEEEFNETLTLIEKVKYSTAFLFAYSMREKTTAYRRYVDNVDRNIKIERLQKMIKLYRSEVEKLYKNQIGQQQLVLVEGESKRSTKDLQGRNDGNVKVIFPSESIPTSYASSKCRPINNGDYVVVHICNANSQILRGIPLYHSSIKEFFLQDDQLQSVRC